MMISWGFLMRLGTSDLFNLFALRPGEGGEL